MKTIKPTGSTVRIWGIFTDSTTDEPVDPDSVVITIYVPDDTTVTYAYGVSSEVIKLSDGVYNCSLTLSVSGTYRWAWTATGPLDIVTIVSGRLDSVPAV